VVALRAVVRPVAPVLKAVARPVAPVPKAVVLKAVVLRAVALKAAAQPAVAVRPVACPTPVAVHLAVVGVVSPRLAVPVAAAGAQDLLAAAAQAAVA
jgi:hypothetical protein